MTNLDPQSTADFWDAYIRAAGGGATCDPSPLADQPASLIERNDLAPNKEWAEFLCLGSLGCAEHSSLANWIIIGAVSMNTGFERAPVHQHQRR